MSTTLRAGRATTAASLPPAIIDIEASGFGAGSYPIEVGVALRDGSTHCRLVAPEPGWTHWDTAAARVHGIERTTLVRHGHGAVEIAGWLNRLLGHTTVYSDAWGFDMPWLALLYEHAGLAQHFRLDGLNRLLSESQRQCWQRAKDEIASGFGLDRHRASADARILQLAYQRTLALTAA